MSFFGKFFFAEADWTCPKPQTVLSGYNTFTRQVLTAGAKEYPQALCRAMVLSTLESLRARIARGGVRAFSLSDLTSTEQWLDNVQLAFGFRMEKNGWLMSW